MEYPIVPDIDAAVMTTNEVSKSTVARRVIRDIFNQNKLKFNFGLETFDTVNTNKGEDGNGRNGRFKIYQGYDSTMRFTNDCVGAVTTIGGGTSPSNGGLRCIPNPERNNGFLYITYEVRSVDLTASYSKNFAWARTNPNYGPPTYTAGSVLDAFRYHSATTSWNVNDSLSTTITPYVDDFSVPFFNFGNPFIIRGLDSPSSPNPRDWMTRLIFVKKGFSFDFNFSGKGKIIEDIKPGTNSTHNTNFLDYMAAETPSLTSKEIKDAAQETPSVGSILTAKDYFLNNISGHPSPITNACQKNYVLFATDGGPTIDASGNKYTSAEADNTSTGRAFTELYSAINSLHDIFYNGVHHNINTYILGVGDSGSAVKSNQIFTNMAKAGGTAVPYYGTDENHLRSAFQDILDNLSPSIPIKQSNGHYALSNPVSSQPAYVYKAFYAGEGNAWQGNLIKAIPSVSLASGILNYDTGTTNVFTNGAAQWLTSSQIDGKSRQIITAVRQVAGGSLLGKAFTWASLGSYTQSLLLNSGETTTLGSKRVNYIRGDRSNELSATYPTGFRRRLTTVLGDIIDSSPVYVKTPTSGYSASDFPAGTPRYATFASTVASRRAMIYVGANDGMLHAFDADTLKEVFAYIPNAVLSKLKDFSSSSYSHDFFVNETPLVADTLVSGNWMTQLIGFPGAGGKGLFALDITSPDIYRSNVNLSQAEANAKNIVLWELNGDTDKDIGYILNRGQVNQQRGGLSQQIGRLANRRWAVLTGNGYNSVNNSTGLLISYLDANNGIPSYKKIMIPGETGGLSTPTAIDIDSDGVIDYAYAGDLKGNVWRFDLHGAEATWSAFKLFVPNSSSPASPITTAPAISFHCSNAGLMIAVGTGKYLESGDNNPGYSDNHPDFMMGIWDKLDTTSVTLSRLQKQEYYASGDVTNPTSGVPSLAQSLILTTDNTVNWSTQRGWYLPLFNNPPRPARILVPPYIRNGLVYFNTTTPDFSTCNNGKLWATTQALNACTGARPQSTVFDINFDGVINSADQYNMGGGSSNVNVTGVNLQAQNRVLDSSIWIKPKHFKCLTPPCSFSTGLSDSVGVNLFQSVPKRISWKQINNVY
ncbi:MAG: PilC/PilY family type IV pilus protein [Pseudomonadota bacterium]